MTDISRVRVGLTGFIGAPGVMTFYCADVAVFINELNNWVDAIKTHMPSVVHLSVENYGDIIDDASGHLTGAWTSTVGGDTVATGEAHYSAPNGFCVTWNTAAILHHHAVRGRTFIVPASSSVLGTDGQMDPTVAGSVQAASQALIDDSVSNMFIWHRPVAGAGGQAVLATTAQVKPKMAILTSRRD